MKFSTLTGLSFSLIYRTINTLISIHEYEGSAGIDLFVLFDLILYVQSTIFQLNRDGSSWIEPVLS